MLNISLKNCDNEERHCHPARQGAAIDEERLPDRDPRVYVQAGAAWNRPDSAQIARYLVRLTADLDSPVRACRLHRARC